MNPWQRSALEMSRDTLRFVMWCGAAVIGILASLWAVWFVGFFLWRLGGWLSRTLFANPW